MVSSNIWYLGSKPNPSIPLIGPVCAAFCQTSDRGIRCPRYWIPRIWSGNFCPFRGTWSPLTPARHPPPLARAHPFPPSPEHVPPAPCWGKCSSDSVDTTDRSCLPQLLRGIRGWFVHLNCLCKERFGFRGGFPCVGTFVISKLAIPTGNH